MFDTLTQPLVAVTFLVSGAVAYVCYEFLRAIKTVFPTRTVEFLTDFLSVAACGGIFLFTAVRYNDGRIVFYEIFCFSVAFLVVRIVMKTTLRKAFNLFVTVLRKKIREKINIVIKKTKTVQTNLERRKYERQRNENNDAKQEDLRLRKNGKRRFGQPNYDKRLFVQRKTRTTDERSQRVRRDESDRR